MNAAALRAGAEPVAGAGRRRGGASHTPVRACHTPRGVISPGDWRGGTGERRAPSRDASPMFQHTVMNYVETSAPAELTLVEWKASRPAPSPRRRLRFAPRVSLKFA